MKAITEPQPFASLIAEGAKTILTRSWRAPASLIGERIAIHAAARPIGNRALALPPWTNVTGEPIARGEQAMYNGMRLLMCPLGAVVATARLVDCAPMVAYDAPSPRCGPLDSLDLRTCLQVSEDRLTYWWHHDAGFRVTDQRPFGDYSPGRWAWLLDDIEKLDVPVPARGKQRLWEWAA